MARVLLCKPFADEDMAQMAAAVGTQNFRTSPIGIGYVFYRTVDLVIEARPSAMRFKFIFRTVERRVTALTHIGAVCLVIE